MDPANVSPFLPLVTRERNFLVTNLRQALHSRNPVRSRRTAARTTSRLPGPGIAHGRDPLVPGAPTGVGLLGRQRQGRVRGGAMGRRRRGSSRERGGARVARPLLQPFILSGISIFSSWNGPSSTCPGLCPPRPSRPAGQSGGPWTRERLERDPRKRTACVLIPLAFCATGRVRRLLPSRRELAIASPALPAAAAASAAPSPPPHSAASAPNAPCPTSPRQSAGTRGSRRHRP